MKLTSRLFLLIPALVCSLLAACTKGAISPDREQSDLLVGRWELTQTDGGLSGRVTPANPNRKLEIVFDTDHHATFYVNGAQTAMSDYSLFKANSYVNRRPQTFLAYGRRTGTEKNFIERLSPSQLVIVEDYADGTGYYYTRR